MFIIEALGVVFILGFLFGRRNSNQYSKKYFELQKKLKSELLTSKSKQVSEVLSRILGTPTTWNTPSNLDANIQPVAQNNVAEQEVQATEQRVQPLQNTNYTVTETVGPHNNFEIRNYVDNTSLLLYFGAFLFISSVGLFVAFAEVEGILRTASVALVALIMYRAGFYLWSTKKKLKQVGEAFIGIGMMAVPFVGITAYNNSFDQSNASSIWLITSIVALMMYAVTIAYLRSTFVSYLLIGSLVSLTQSFVGISEGPIYYFIWMLAVTGILMQFLSIFSRTIPPLRDASSNSGQIFIPLALFASVLTSTTQGLGQLAMTTGLATLYYGLHAITNIEKRRDYTAITHILAITTTLIATFAITESLQAMANVLIIIALLHALALFVFKKYLYQDIIHQNIMLASAMFIIVVSLIDYQPTVIVVGLTTLFVLSSLIAFVFRYLYSLLLALGTWITLSYAIGQLLLNQRLDSIEQAVLSVIFVLPWILILSLNKFGSNQLWKESVSDFFHAGLVIALIVGLFGTPYQIMFLSLWLFIITVTANKISKDTRLSSRYIAIFFVGAPMAYAIFAQTHLSQPGYFTTATLLLLVVMIVYALRYKFEFARWVGTVAWLLLPVALTADKIFGLSSMSGFNAAWLYTVAIVGLSIARAIARGKILPNHNVPLASLARSSSHSYYMGIIISAGIVYLASFGNFQNSFIPTLFIITVTFFLLWHFKNIEKSNSFAGLLPIFIQLALLRFIEPYSTSSTIFEADNAVLYPLFSSTVAILFYVNILFQDNKTNTHDSLSRSDFLSVALATAFIAPASFIFTNDVSWAIPITLMVAGCLLLFHSKQQSQKTKELVGGLIFFGLVWLLWYFGVENVQVYTHLLAALFALYAYIRHLLNDVLTSDQYLTAMLATSTIPLILQSLAANSPQYLGIWLLLEQTGFFLLGILLQKPFVTKWGLYVAIGAVIYQLRDLGWAMLAVLSLFIIGIAIYRALKQPEDK